jgi:hypothetical protein
MEQQNAGSLKPDTIAKYAGILMRVVNLNKPFDIYVELNGNGADFKLAGFLIKQQYIIKRPDGTYAWISPKRSEAEISEIIAEFGVYRKNTEDKRQQDLKDLKYYQENKEFLLDTRLSSQAEPLSIGNLPKELRYQIATTAAEYAELALKSGKKDIKGFIFHLFTLE